MHNHNLDGLGLLASNFKCFGDTPQGFKEFFPFNIIIGRNNSGKSALIDLVECVTPNIDRGKKDTQRRRPAPDQRAYHRVSLRNPMIKNSVAHAVRNNQLGPRAIPQGGQNIANPVYEHLDEVWVIGETQIQNSTKAVKAIVREDKLHGYSDLVSEEIIPYSGVCKGLLESYRSPYERLYLLRISAERDIKKQREANVRNDLKLFPSGSEATRVIWAFQNRGKLERSLVNEQLLNGMNEIYEGDNVFTSITVAQHEDGINYEIQLEEVHKGWIDLSASGSSLKTVILVLMNLLLMPITHTMRGDQFIFAFEELENNLHPALLRRLFSYLEKYQAKHKCTFILTTHSSIAIDWFAKKDNAQILHVTHDGNEAKVSEAISYHDQSAILDDLEVKASDLLQANCVIWVEGPSDRVYLNRWIKLWADGELQEGAHYQIAIYGGALIRHFSAEDPNGEQERVPFLNLNRNSVILIDSDKRGPKQRLKKDALRIKQEAEEQDMSLIWITKGKEVENYVTRNAWKAFRGDKDVKVFDPYDVVFEAAGIRQYKGNKVTLARGLVEHMQDKEEIRNHMDLGERLDELCSMIYKWNHIQEPPLVEDITE